MITSLDPEFRETLEVKEGKRKLPLISQLLIEWVNAEYKVDAINIYYDSIIGDNRPRIQVIFDNYNDYSSFKENGIGNYLADRQSAIAKKYRELVLELKLAQSNPTNNVFVCFSEFSAIYKSTIFNNVPKGEINKLLDRYISSKIWTINILGSGLAVFFYTNKEKDNPDNEVLLESLRQEYFSLLKPYDKFDYFKSTWILKDSKEDFDEVYEGSWYNWSRNH